MKNKMNIVIVSSNQNERIELKDKFEKSGLIVEEFAEALPSIQYVKENACDLIISDVILPGKDGFYLTENVKKISPNTKVVLASAISGDGFINKGLKLGADYFIEKPFDSDTISERMLEVMQNFESPKTVTKAPKNKALEEKISNIFITVGIPAHIKGYQFLREAIKMAIENPEVINSITKKLYPSIAERFDTSASKVERAIRHAIEVAWNRGKIENINALFGIRVYSNNEKPTNGEFIALVADKMLIEGGY